MKENVIIDGVSYSFDDARAIKKRKEKAKAKPIVKEKPPVKEEKK